MSREGLAILKLGDAIRGAAAVGVSKAEALLVFEHAWTQAEENGLVGALAVPENPPSTTSGVSDGM